MNYFNTYKEWRFFLDIVISDYYIVFTFKWKYAQKLAKNIEINVFLMNRQPRMI